jgi:ABC-2 type transport system ATP-binding protein
MGAKEIGEIGMINVQSLSKAFGTKLAVNNVSFTVERGEVLGFLGPNGAGKSTTMRMITGFIPPSAGTVSVGGYDIGEKPIEAKRLMGYLPENAPAYTDMTVNGFLNFAAEIRGLRGESRKKAVDRVVEMCFLESVLHQSVETLSKGFRHRTCFAQSIIHDPDVLVLDEPTDGLDQSEARGANLIRRMGEKKAIIFRHTFWKKSRRSARARLLLIGVRWPMAHRNSSNKIGPFRCCVCAGRRVAATELKQKLAQLPTVKRTSIIKRNHSGYGANLSADRLCERRSGPKHFELIARENGEWKSAYWRPAR